MGDDAPPARSGRHTRVWVPLAVVALAAVVAVVLIATGDADGGGPATTTEPAAVTVTSDAPRFATLDELVAASDVIVRAEVVATERGRLFGDPASDSAIESRLVTLDVAEVLRGEGEGVAPGATVLVEEEGWLPDGAPLVVDGAAPSTEGDDGIWFLVAGGDPEVDAYVVVNSQGRYLLAEDGDDLRGAAGDDPLVAELSTLALSELAARIGGLPGRTSPSVPG